MCKYKTLTLEWKYVLSLSLGVSNVIKTEGNLTVVQSLKRVNLDHSPKEQLLFLTLAVKWQVSRLS